MRDVVKTNVKRNQNSKRKRRRKRHTMLYFFLVIFLVMGIGILLSVTLFFNVKKITVNGDVDYTNENIIVTSGINNGDNLIRIDSKKVSESILSAMLYIETADIEKQYPGTVIINVTGCVSTANVECKDGYLIVSAKGKILEKVKDASDELPIVKGLELKSESPGSYLKSTDKQKTEIAIEFLGICGNKKTEGIRSIDLTDQYEISVNYDDRITFKMGNSNDMAYKLNLSGTVFEKIEKNRTGTMTMAGRNQISFRESGEVKRQETDSKKNKIPIKNTESPEDSSEQPEGFGDEDGEEYIGEEYSQGEYSGEEYSWEESYDEQNYEEPNYDNIYNNEDYGVEE